MGIWETKIVSSKEGDLPLEDEDWPGVSLIFLIIFQDLILLELA
jgi:hypothetical protein